MIRGLSRSPIRGPAPARKKPQKPTPGFRQCLDCTLQPAGVLGGKKGSEDGFWAGNHPWDLWSICVNGQCDFVLEVLNCPVGIISAGTETWCLPRDCILKHCSVGVHGTERLYFKSPSDPLSICFVISPPPKVANDRRPRRPAPSTKPPSIFLDRLGACLSKHTSRLFWDPFFVPSLCIATKQLTPSS